MNMKLTMGLKTHHILILTLGITSISVFAAPASSTESLVITSTEQAKSSSSEPTTEQPEKNEKTPRVPKIYSMKVETDVKNRFATTLMTSKVKNLDEKSQEATFAVVLPDTAYISAFVMEIDGKKYEAYVKEKEEAKKIYDNAVQSGAAAAHVEANARDSNRFTVSVNIEPQSKATFYLTYEELLKRENGAYDIIINLHPGQPIKDLSVEVNINETRPLRFVKAPPLRSGNEIGSSDDHLDPKANIEHFNETSARITFRPDLERQKELGQHLGNKEDSGLAGQFIVQYDVQRDPNGGEILVSDGYFVHFFAPSDLKPMDKHVVFVLDTSGSMSGVRIQQLKEAMKSILGQLRAEDSFNIIDFNSIVNVWNIPEVKVQYVEGESYDYNSDGMAIPKDKSNQTLPESFKASEKNIEFAQKVIDKLEAFGGTDIKSSLVLALQLLNETQDQRSETKQPLIMFLTDGEATVGEYGDQAIKSITTANSDDIPIFSLSFGDGADRDFLEKLSLKNQGFARHIYEAADASLQLEEFYRFISSPLLTKVNFKYVSKSISNLTQTDFPIMFNGSEIVVAGIIESDSSNSPTKNVSDVPPTAPNGMIQIDEGGLIAPEVTGWGSAGSIDLKPEIGRSLGSLEKHWAYITLKQIFDERDVAENKKPYTQRALKIALKYSFVTPVSSLVVVKPNDTKSEATPEDASKTQPSFDSLAFSSANVPGTIQFADSFVPLSGLNSYAEESLVEHDPVDRIFIPSPLIVGGQASAEASGQAETVETLKMKLVWLNDILEKNETLTLKSGNYKLGMDANVDSRPECPKSPANKAGECTLIKDCPEIFNKLTDLKTYNEYFCPLEGFAGVCCPKPETIRLI